MTPKISQHSSIPDPNQLFSAIEWLNYTGPVTSREGLKLSTSKEADKTNQ